MAHITADYVVTRDGSMPVHFTTQQSALGYYSESPGYAEMVAEPKTVACYRPTRGYCGFCHSFEHNAGVPDYNEGTERIVWDSPESFHLVAE